MNNTNYTNNQNETNANFAVNKNETNANSAVNKNEMNTNYSINKSTNQNAFGVNAKAGFVNDKNAERLISPQNIIGTQNNAPQTKEVQKISQTNANTFNTQNADTLNRVPTFVAPQNTAGVPQNTTKTSPQNAQTEDDNMQKQNVGASANTQKNSAMQRQLGAGNIQKQASKQVGGSKGFAYTSNGTSIGKTSNGKNPNGTAKNMLNANLAGGAVNFASLGALDPLKAMINASGSRVKNFDNSLTGVYSSSGYNQKPTTNSVKSSGFNAKKIENPARRTGRNALRQKANEINGVTDEISAEPEELQMSNIADEHSINSRRKQLEERLKPTALDGIPYSDDMAKENLRARRKANRKNKPTSGEEIRITYLGGVGEIGKNMTAIEYNGEIVVIDCGVMFPSEDMPGIDYVVPDTTYLNDNADKVKAFFITHGHEDHIGAIPYVIKNFPKASIYSSRLTLALIENKLHEHNIKNVSLRVAQAREPYKIGNFAVEFIDVNHSIADAYAIKISTPAGTIFHSGDFKIDFRPIDGKMIDLPRIAEIGEEGVDLFMCESTNVERPGYTISESDVGAKIEEIFKDSVGRRVYVATFSSNIYRVQQIINLAIKYGRRVATVGRSIANNLEAATKVGKMNFKKSVFVDMDKINNLPDGEVVVICTGAQGETASALSRLANGDYPNIEIGSNDTVILSSSPIPGNESMINRIINNLCKKGAIVIHENVHASGHACQEELKTIHSLIKPKNFVPVHGEYRHLKRHAELAESLGTPRENIMVVENGNSIILRDGQIYKTDSVKAEDILIDGNGEGDIASAVLRDRRQLGEDGIAVITMVLSKQNKALLSYPVILTRGLVYQDEAEQLNAEIQRVVIEAIQGIINLPKFDIEEAKNLIRRPVRAYFNKKMGRSPVILPIFHVV
mgnify:CR=1 FL=1